jgi:hypothetical protein
MGWWLRMMIWKTCVCVGGGGDAVVAVCLEEMRRWKVHLARADTLIKCRRWIRCGDLRTFAERDTSQSNFAVSDLVSFKPPSSIRVWCFTASERDWAFDLLVGIPIFVYPAVFTARRYVILGICRLQFCLKLVSTFRDGVCVSSSL